MASIRKRGHRWVAEVSRNGRRRNKSFPTETEAQAWATRLELCVFSGASVRTTKRRATAPTTAAELWSVEEIRAAAEIFRRIVGVYFLLSGDSIVYVGQTVDFDARLARHRIASRKVFDRYAIIECAQRDLNVIEQHYIRKFQPLYNRTRGRLSPDPVRQRPL